MKFKNIILFGILIHGVFIKNGLSQDLPIPSFGLPTLSSGPSGIVYFSAGNVKAPENNRNLLAFLKYKDTKITNVSAKSTLIVGVFEFNEKIIALNILGEYWIYDFNGSIIKQGKLEINGIVISSAKFKSDKLYILSQPEGVLPEEEKYILYENSINLDGVNGIKSKVIKDNCSNGILIGNPVSSLWLLGKDKASFLLR